MPQKARGLTVEEYLESLNPKARDLTNRLRIMVKKALPRVVEEINPWGNPVYTIEGKRVAWILNYTRHVDFGFFMGAKLHSELLEGSGKLLRHIKVRSAKDIDESEFTRLLKEAVKLASDVY